MELAGATPVLKLQLERRLPRYVYDREGMLGSLDRLAAPKKGGARIFFGHDPEFWQTVPQAPAFIVV